MVAEESQAMRIGVLGINHQIKLIMLPLLMLVNSMDTWLHVQSIRMTFGEILLKEIISIH